MVTEKLHLKYYTWYDLLVKSINYSIECLFECNGYINWTQCLDRTIDDEEQYLNNRLHCDVINEFTFSEMVNHENENYF